MLIVFIVPWKWFIWKGGHYEVWSWYQKRIGLVDDGRCFLVMKTVKERVGEKMGCRDGQVLKMVEKTQWKDV